MKISALILALPLVLTLAACDQKPASTADKVKDKVKVKEEKGQRALTPRAPCTRAQGTRVGKAASFTIA